MKDNTVEFNWIRTKAGYQLIKGVPWMKRDEEPQLWIFEADAQFENPYNPLDVQDLFIRFSQLATDHKDILEFATSYGLLTNGEKILEAHRHGLTRKEALYLHKYGVLNSATQQQFTDEEIINLPEQQYEIDSKPLQGEPLKLWTQQIEKMKEAYDLWRKRESIKRVQSIVNEGMWARISPRLLRDSGSHRGRYLVPHNLLGGLWLQFADAIDGESELRKCAECGTRFTAGGGNRSLNSNSEMCSAKCRMKRYRKRVAQAKSLHGKGVPVEEIAEYLSISLEMAKKWVTYRQVNK